LRKTFEGRERGERRAFPKKKEGAVTDPRKGCKHLVIASKPVEGKTDLGVIVAVRRKRSMPFKAPGQSSTGFQENQRRKNWEDCVKGF